MVNVLHIYLHMKLVKRSILVRQLTNLDTLGTAKRVIESF